MAGSYGWVMTTVGGRLLGVTLPLDRVTLDVVALVTLAVVYRVTLPVADRVTLDVVERVTLDVVDSPLA